MAYRNDFRTGFSNLKWTVKQTADNFDTSYLCDLIVNPLIYVFIVEIILSHDSIVVITCVSFNTYVTIL